MKKANSPFRKSVTALLTAVLLLQAVLPSCEKAPADDPGSAVTPDTAVTETSAETEETSPEEETEAANKPDGSIDSDADSLDGITIESAEELARIGMNRKYPLDGDYFLVADIDLSELGSFTPIGGSESECGIVEGNNVFSGTFDGRGHTIIGLNIDVSDTDR